MGDVWFRFFPSNWLGGVSGLSAAERGVYITLLALIYDTGGPITREDDRLARRCGLPKSGFVRALEALKALGKIEEADGCLFNLRAKFELTETAARKDAASNAATSRWEKEKENQRQKDAGAYTGASTAQCGNDAPKMPRLEPQPHTPSSSLRSEDCPKRVRTKVGYSGRFEVFWSGYPTDPNMSKKKAWEVWQKFSADDQDLAIRSLPGFRAYCEKSKDYRPVHAERYLSQERFRGHAESQTKVAAASAAQVFVKTDTPQWAAWREYKIATTGRSMNPHNGGWYFPSEWPPSTPANSEAAA